MGIDDTFLLLEFCLKNTYFSSQGQLFEQVEGEAMGSLVSPIVANLYMEYLEHLCQMGFGQDGEKKLNMSSSEAIDRVNNQGTTGTPAASKEVKSKALLSYPTHKVCVKVSKRSVVDMASKLTSKVAVPSRTSWFPPRTKALWSTKVMPYIGVNIGTLAVMIST